MITAIDTNVLLDVFGADPRFGSRSQQALRSCMLQGSLVACDVVWAEVAGFFLDPAMLTGAMNSLGIEFRAVSMEAALDAGKRWRGYRQRGGKRDRVVADFLVGAHALREAERLLTRDRGFYRTYFRDLHLLDPSEAS